MYKELKSNGHRKKQFSSIIHAIFEANHVDLKNEGEFLGELKASLSQYLGLTKSKRKDADLDFYGLSGAGLQFRNRPIKVLCRHSAYKELIDSIVLPSSKNLKSGDPLNKLFVEAETKEI